MTIFNIMVSLDLAATDRVQLAAGVAEGFGAKLTGVAARQPLILVPVEDILEVAHINEIEHRRASEQLVEAKAMFLSEAGLKVQTAWRFAQAPPLAYLVEQARAADLVVVGRHGPKECDLGPMDVPAGGLLMEVGRSVLVAPPGINRLAARRVVVAWKDTREARRAVYDALPFLTQAEQVHVVAIGLRAYQKGVEDAATYLSGHGVNVTSQLLSSPEVSTADEIVRFAQRQEADLIVMGAYGYSRLREWIFGGVTHDILQTTPVCCLMSH